MKKYTSSGNLWPAPTLGGTMKKIVFVSVTAAVVAGIVYVARAPQADTRQVRANENARGNLR